MTGDVRVALALVVVALGGAAWAQPAAETIPWPPGLITNAEKGEWIGKEFAEIDAQAKAETAGKPEVKWSRARLEQLVARARGLRALNDAGTMTEADYALDALDHWQRQADAAKRRVDEPRRAREQAAAVAASTERTRIAAISAGGYPSEDTKRMAERKAWIGMSGDQALLSWGQPSRRHERITATGKTEVWSYGSSSLTFSTGRVVAIDQSR